MPAAQAEQVRRAGALRWQAGDLVVHLGVPAASPPTLVHEPAGLREPRPHQPGGGRAGAGMEGPAIDAPMAAVKRPRAGCGPDGLERNAAAPAAGPADCP
jgi:hypothetical protein